MPKSTKLVTRDLRQLAQVVIDQKPQYEALKTKVLKADGYIFWAERSLKRILAPYLKHENEPSLQAVSVTQAEAEVLDMVGTKLRVFVETFAAYQIFLESSQTVLKSFDEAKALLEAHPGGMMPGKGVVNAAMALPLVESFCKILAEIPEQRKVLEASLEICAEGRITEGIDKAQTALVLLPKIQTLRKAIGVDAIQLIKSTTVQ